MQIVFFFQAEDGIRDVAVTGVQTCALPILCGRRLYGDALLSASASVRHLAEVENRQQQGQGDAADDHPHQDRKSTRLNSSHGYISYAVFCLKKKDDEPPTLDLPRARPVTRG